MVNDPLSFVDIDGLDWLSTLTDFAAGFGDTISMGLTSLIREGLDVDDTVNYCSSNYLSGQISGVLFELGFMAATQGAFGGWTVSFNRYPKAGGVGMNILKNGGRKFGLDWHRFKLGGKLKEKMVNRPHYHRGATKNQMKKHRPYQGGW